ncbi:hypothetical protein [Streptomyces lichenis]|uniref:Uncharacterized protein n=1 Tax=Streptomyces lichenis TaxID=2306967 RepID=A0ABT0I9K9_9ACTN|nr:hypothetical protein [Streptomyces lichenis]MCK8677988.1 hypothetical protein [Streptomyces lichenis]
MAELSESTRRHLQLLVGVVRRAYEAIGAGELRAYIDSALAPCDRVLTGPPLTGLPALLVPAGLCQWLIVLVMGREAFAAAFPGPDHWSPPRRSQ